jgi:cell wall-associated NlpC family hydrolase
MEKINSVIYTVLLLFVLSFRGWCPELPAQQPEESLAKVLTRVFRVSVSSSDDLSLYATIATWLGTPYRRSQSSRSGSDCSGFVLGVYREVYGVKLPHSSREMMRGCVSRILSHSALKAGDLLFFDTHSRDPSQSTRPTHVGIYLKDGKFAHASSSHGVTLSSLSAPYYKRSWMCGGVVLRCLRTAE